jgi:hypothetical protein
MALNLSDPDSNQQYEIDGPSKSVTKVCAGYAR